MLAYSFRQDLSGSIHPNHSTTITTIIASSVRAYWLGNKLGRAAAAIAWLILLFPVVRTAAAGGATAVSSLSCFGRRSSACCSLATKPPTIRTAAFQTSGTPAARRCSNRNSKPKIISTAAAAAVGPLFSTPSRSTRTQRMSSNNKDDSATTRSNNRMDGKQVALEIRAEIKEMVAQMTTTETGFGRCFGGKPPRLANLCEHEEKGLRGGGHGESGVRSRRGRHPGGTAGAWCKH